MSGDIDSNRHLVGTRVAIKLAEEVAADLKPSTIGFLLRAAHEERLAALSVPPEDYWPPLTQKDQECIMRSRSGVDGPAEPVEDILRRVQAG